MGHRDREECDVREVFQQELGEVRARLVELASLVADSIQDASAAFDESDIGLAERVIAGDRVIDAATATLDELAIDILARQQPVATDLRLVVSALRISASLERMGDMAGHIAQLARYRFPEKVARKSLRPHFEELGRLDTAIARQLVDLLETNDLDVAKQIQRDDDKVDALRDAVLERMLGEKWKGEPMDTVDATLASRYYERFADHAVKIAKKIEYLRDGEWVRPEA